MFLRLPATKRHKHICGPGKENNTLQYPATIQRIIRPIVAVFQNYLPLEVFYFLK